MWVTKMLVYEYDIIYKKGKENLVVDSFPQKYEYKGSLFSLAFAILNWIIKYQYEWLVNTTLAQVI